MGLLRPGLHDAAADASRRPQSRRGPYFYVHALLETGAEGSGYHAPGRRFLTRFPAEHPFPDAEGTRPEKAAAPERYFSLSESEPQSAA